MDRLIDDELHCTALLYHKRSLLHAAYNNHRTSLNTTMLLYENGSLNYIYKELHSKLAR